MSTGSVGGETDVALAAVLSHFIGCALGCSATIKMTHLRRREAGVEDAELGLGVPGMGEFSRMDFAFSSSVSAKENQ